MKHDRSSTPPNVQRDLRDIQHTVDHLVRQFAPQHRHALDPNAVRSLLAAVSYKLGYVQGALRG
ncbi:hypothetical protein [Paludibacterium sp.]|uniref:hypothetical protein n=1 Tax=Paludibacterium sp. TaxID=1917523 RepID=UPI001DD10617|nr:hypothetical protein [Paludibacterium sp.]MBV8059935.1 hypothetical protein [Alphaproteobacteria bacterium]MBV8646716.1 hypothetical protein [Paludibacterium sp.]